MSKRFEDTKKIVVEEQEMIHVGKSKGSVFISWCCGDDELSIKLTTEETREFAYYLNLIAQRIDDEKKI